VVQQVLLVLQEIQVKEEMTGREVQQVTMELADQEVQVVQEVQEVLPVVQDHRVYKDNQELLVQTVLLDQADPVV
jgi:hypothetical protein